MTLPLHDDCYIDEVTEPVQLIDVLPATESSAATTTSCRASNLIELEGYFNNVATQDYQCRFISVCQKTSWSRLQVTRDMLDLIVSQNDIGRDFWDLPSCFYRRSNAVEDSFCIPTTYTDSDPEHAVLYTLRYPEWKEDDKEWTIRQSGLYHRFNVQTGQSLIVLFSPLSSPKAPNSESAFHKKIAKILLDNKSNVTEMSVFWIHELFFSTYFPIWRQYTASLERSFIKTENQTFSTFIDEPLRFGYDNLSSIVKLTDKFLQIPVTISRGIEVLDDLLVLLKTHDYHLSGAGLVNDLQNHRRRAVTYSQRATYLCERSRATSQLQSDTLSFRDQLVAKEQNGNMLRLNKSAVFITTLTLVYLPASFVATFFGMNFFSMDVQAGGIISTPMIWIYVVAALSLTVITFLSYYWMIRNDGPLLSSMAPKVRFVDWEGLSRKFTLRGGKINDGMELQGLPKYNPRHAK